MKTLTLRKSALLCITTLALAASARAATPIAPWPATQPFMWDTEPFSPVSGTVSVVPPDVLQMSGVGTGSKNDWWLPYPDAAYAEKMCVAKFVFSTPVTNVHARVYDPATAGACGWAIILKDSAGRILDFGLRTYFANKQITAHQYDGTNWTNLYFADRGLAANDYYTMNFTNNGDGTITYHLESQIYDGVGGFTFATNTLVTAVTYGEITEIYLNAMSKNTTTANFKWTEFSTSPAVISPPPLYMARTNTTDVALWWPSPWTTSFVVQTNADLSPAGWGASTATPYDDGVNITVTLPIGAGNQFFRLKN